MVKKVIMRCKNSNFGADLGDSPRFYPLYFKSGEEAQMKINNVFLRSENAS
jgi:hypothetical protein